MTPFYICFKKSFISISMPLEIEMGKISTYYLVFVASLFVVLIFILIVVYYFVKKLDAKDKILLKQINNDGL